MGFFSRFFSDEAGAADAPVVSEKDSFQEADPVAFDYLLAMMETGKI